MFVYTMTHDGHTIPSNVMTREQCEKNVEIMKDAIHGDIITFDIVEATPEQIQEDDTKARNEAYVRERDSGREAVTIYSWGV